MYTIIKTDEFDGWLKKVKDGTFKKGIE